MDKRFRNRLHFPWTRRSSDVASALLIAVTCLLFIHSSNLRTSLAEISLSSPSTNTVQVEASSPAVSDRHVEHSHLTGGDGFTFVNRTAEAEQQDLVVFTKIKRCGGTVIGHILHRLSRGGKRFTAWDEDPYRTKRLLPEGEKQAVHAIEEMDGVAKPAVVIKDMSHLDFKLHGHQKPIYVSMVRDPLEHAHSWFYWLRAPYAVVERARAHGKQDALSFLPKATFLKKSFETCLEEGDPECGFQAGTKRIGHPMQAFCTRSPECSLFGSRAALQEAKQVVEREYAVVGLLEDWETSLHVLERMVPRFFAGAADVYRDNERTLLPPDDIWRRKLWY